MSSLDAKSMQILILIASGASRVYVVLLTLTSALGLKFPDEFTPERMVLTTKSRHVVTGSARACPRGRP